MAGLVAAIWLDGIQVEETGTRREVRHAQNTIHSRYSPTLLCLFLYAFQQRQRITTIEVLQARAADPNVIAPMLFRWDWHGMACR